MTEIKFKRDTAFRKSFFVPDSFSHPAKMDAQLLIWITIKYSQVGDVILDPMAGSGTTMLACTIERDVVLVELEEKFCKMMRDNWEQVRMRPQLGFQMGDCQIIQGDARQLEGLVDKIVTSPPFAGNKGGLRSAESFAYGNDKELGKRMMGGIKGGTGSHPDNIDNLPYGEIDKCIFSPPYADEPTISESYLKIRSAIGRDTTKPSQQYRKYSEAQNNIGNLKSESYLEAMLQVYQQCYKVLKPEGLMILVTKNFIRQKKVVRLDIDTIKLCAQAGFTYIERHKRKLPAQSFWRVIYHQKHPEVEQIKYEDILVFRKG